MQPAEGQSEATEEQSDGRAWPGIGMLMLMISIGIRINRLEHMNILGGGRVESFTDVSISKLFLYLAILIFTANLLRRPRKHLFRIDLPGVLLLLWLVWESLSIIWSMYPEVAPRWIRRSAIGVVVYVLVIIYVVDLRDLNQWGHLMLYMSLGLFASALYEGVVVGWTHWFGDHRPYMGVFGRWAVMLIPIGLHYLIYGRDRPEKILGAAAVFSDLGTIYLIERRTPLLALPVVALLYLAMIGYRRKEFVIGATAGLAGAIVALLTNERLLERMEQILIVFRPEGAWLWETMPRLIQFRAGVEAVQKHWLLGMGIGSFQHWINDIYGFVEDFHLHNLVLELLSELGVMGLVLFGGFLLVALIRAWRAYRYFMDSDNVRPASLVAALICSMVAVLIYAQFQPLLYESHLYVAAALCAASYAAALHQSQNESTPEAAELSVGHL